MFNFFLHGSVVLEVLVVVLGDAAAAARVQVVLIVIRASVRTSGDCLVKRKGTNAYYAEVLC